MYDDTVYISITTNIMLLTYLHNVYNLERNSMFTHIHSYKQHHQVSYKTLSLYFYCILSSFGNGVHALTSALGRLSGYMKQITLSHWAFRRLTEYKLMSHWLSNLFSGFNILFFFLNDNFLKMFLKWISNGKYHNQNYLIYRLWMIGQGMTWIYSRTRSTIMEIWNTSSYLTASSWTGECCSLHQSWSCWLPLSCESCHIL